MAELTLYSDGEETTALYVDGKLDRVGDNYWVIERVLEIAGVETVHDDAFIRGGNGRDGVAQTITEIAEYAAKRDELTSEREAIIAERDALLARAAELGIKLG